MAEPLEHAPATRVGECTEDPVQIPVWFHHIVKHMLEYPWQSPAGPAVDQLADDVGMTGVPGRLLQQVRQHPPEADRRTGR